MQRLRRDNEEEKQRKSEEADVMAYHPHSLTELYLSHPPVLETKFLSETGTNSRIFTVSLTFQSFSFPSISLP